MPHRYSRPRADTIVSVLAKAIALELLGRWVMSPYETMARRAAIHVFAAISSGRLEDALAALPPTARDHAIRAINLAIDGLQKTDAVEQRLIKTLDNLRERLA
jgi:hypothetical protein